VPNFGAFGQQVTIIAISHPTNLETTLFLLFTIAQINFLHFCCSGFSEQIREAPHQANVRL